MRGAACRTRKAKALAAALQAGLPGRVVDEDQRPIRRRHTWLVSLSTAISAGGAGRIGSR
ncbi:hypothetical protein [Thermomonospora curvata]|uniref:hypothetical protein n=1 Tax=Thermomonospora curvata TaxID=2020 RepID=UPI00019ECDCD|nr:hypothetical protein [Thermomonospora curvata]